MIILACYFMYLIVVSALYMIVWINKVNENIPPLTQGVRLFADLAGIFSFIFRSSKNSYQALLFRISHLACSHITIRWFLFMFTSSFLSLSQIRRWYCCLSTFYDISPIFISIFSFLLCFLPLYA